MSRRNASGELEARVLRRLRTSPTPLTGREVWRGFAGEGAPARTTILTVLSRLESKGLVIRHNDAEPALFGAAHPESVAVAEQMERLLARAADRRAVLTQFAGLLHPADLAALSQSREAAT